ncbi:MAG: cobalt ECF transporter T component CbiQ [Bacillota bacterium]
MINIDAFAYTNRLRYVNPAEKTVFALLTLFICLGFSSLLVSGIVIVMMSIVTIYLAGIPVKVYSKLLLLPLSFLLVGVLTIIVSIGTNGLAANAGDWLIKVTVAGRVLGVTQLKLIFGAGILGKSLGSVSCLYFLSLTTPMVELASIMRKLKFPVIFVELLELMYRFIFVLQKTSTDIFISQASRWGYSSTKNSMKSLGQLTAALFIRSLYRSQALYIALSARGYTDKLNVLGPEYEISINNIIFIVIINSALIIAGLVGRQWI